MIIQTGMRTDIPAFYHEWLLNRIKEGFVLVRNPYNPLQVTKYSLSPKVVDLIAFCTKDPSPMLPYMEVLKPYGQYWFVTVTPYGKDIEPNVPDKLAVLESFKKLSDIVGAHRIGWRYDPVFISTEWPVERHIKAFEYMATAGWKTDQMMNGISGIMNLAAASGEDLGRVSDIVTDALTALGMTADDSAHFADILAAASSNANTNVSLMGESFKYCAPLAGAMGASAEDLSIALGLMANSGIKGSQAGNSLKNALVNLVKPTDAQAAAMEALGLITTETVNVIDQAEVDKAMAKVESKTIDVQKAQIAYNDAVAKYGAESSQAQTKMLNLQKQENALTSAQESLTKAQQGTIKTISTGQSEDTLAVLRYAGTIKKQGK